MVVTAEQLRRRVPGGIGTYVCGLAQGLAAMGADAPDVSFVGGRLPPSLLTRAWDRRWLGVPGGSGLVHATSTAVPWRGGGPRVVAIHDVAWRVVPEAFPSHGRQWHEAAVQRALSRAAALVVPSEATAAALGAAGRAVVIELGCDHLPWPDDLAAGALLDRLGVHGPYLLTVSTLEPRKNLARLVEAYALARPRLPEPWPLVVVGPVGWGAEVQVVPGVLLGGFVSGGALASLYARAQCVAYVPLVEGFGLPAVEAMRAGAPVVASPMPSTGGAALEVNPLDSEAIAAGVLSAAADEQQRSLLIAAGRARAGQLRWEVAARAHVAVWEQTAQAPRTQR
jgi:glycosyltransferase involved in cell wall biosynthesis